MTAADRALLALRDCGVVRASPLHAGYAELAASDLAFPTRRFVSGGWVYDYQLTERGKAVALSLFGECL
jgi:hypothetical protein